MKLFQLCLTALTLMTSLVVALPNILALPRRIRDTTNSTTTSSHNARYVFAHFIVGLTANRQGAADWDADMIRAKSYGIDAFALNIGTNDFTDTQLGYAYTSAANNGMKVFLSIDFNWYSTGATTAVAQKVTQYMNLPAQLMVDGKPFVSTFVGDGLNVAALRNAIGTPIYFAPNFHPSYGTDLSLVDAAFNWLGWPNNGNNRAPNPGQTGTVEAGDSQYMNALGTKDYMAPVSPWFFTHYGAEVSYSKNWLFPGDMLYYQRWSQLLTLGPRFIEIVSWNDYGESHYVGPLSSPHTDDGASKWINDMPHDGWLDMAKPFIAAFKANANSVNNYITSDQIIYWYRPQPMNMNCDATDTCMQPVNNADYYIGPPNGWQTVTDNVFVVTLLQSGATLDVTSGNITKSFTATAGASSFTVPMGIGQQQFKLSRNGQTVLSGTSMKDIINGCVCGLYNFNAYVGTLPTGLSASLRSDGYTVFTTGLKVSTCAATASLGSATPTASTTKSTSAVNATSSSTISTTSSGSTLSNTSSSTSSTSTTAPSTTTSSSAGLLRTSKSSSSTTLSTTTSASTKASTTLSTTSTSPTTTSSTSSSSTTTSSSTTKSSTSSSTTTSLTTTPSTTSSSTTTKSTTASTTPSTTSSSTTTKSTTASTTPSTSSSTTTTKSTTASTTPSSASSTTTTSKSTTSPTTTPSTTLSTTTTSKTTSSTTSSSSPVCTAGFGSGNYGGLCSFCCNYGYCPPGPCTCSGYGAQNPPPPENGVNGQPAAGLDSSYAGLCSYACNHGYCPSGACRAA